MAVHARPAAFEGADGRAYSADILTDETGERDAPWGAYLFFLRWGPGEPEADGHLETDFLARGASELAVRHAVGAMPLETVKATLDGLIRARGRDRAASGDAASPAGDAALPRAERPWWEIMREEDDA